MILVLLGTSPYPFSRLLDAVEAWAVSSKADVIAQTGHAPVEHIQRVRCFPFAEHEEILRWIDKAEIVISQGGFGSLRDCLSLNKPTIAVPRQPELGECLHHQCDLVRALAKMGRLIALEDVSALPDAIGAARRFTPKNAQPSPLPDILAQTIEHLLGRSWS